MFVCPIFSPCTHCFVGFVGDDNEGAISSSDVAESSDDRQPTTDTTAEMTVSQANRLENQPTDKFKRLHPSPSQDTVIMQSPLCSNP